MVLVNNVLLDPLPTGWNDYYLNTWYQIGIQIYLLQDDKELADYEKINAIIDLLFLDEDTNELRPYPQGKELDECIKWFLNGWCHDKTVKQKNDIKLLDFDIDQWRIYADFRQIYHINLNDTELHFWEFMGLLWNMPYKYSSFLQVIEIRKKKPGKKDSPEVKKAIAEAQNIYGLGRTAEKTYSEEEQKKIDEYDRQMEAIKAFKRVGESQG